MKEIDLGFTKLEIYDDYVIARARDGVDMALTMHQQAMEAVGKEIEDPWGMIIDMVNSYSVQLPVIHAIRDNQDIHSVAIVCYREASKVSMRQAADMIEKPAILACNLDEARDWIKKNRTETEAA